jgi:hypothetical protein
MSVCVFVIPLEPSSKKVSALSRGLSGRFVVLSPDAAALLLALACCSACAFAPSVTQTRPSFCRLFVYLDQRDRTDITSTKSSLFCCKKIAADRFEPSIPSNGRHETRF